MFAGNDSSAIKSSAIDSAWTEVRSKILFCAKSHPNHEIRSFQSGGVRNLEIATAIGQMLTFVSNPIEKKVPKIEKLESARIALKICTISKL